MANEPIREAARAARVPLWRIADELGVSEATMTRCLRRELPQETAAQMLRVIHQLKHKGGDVNHE